jgi:hypothetical protein
VKIPKSYSPSSYKGDFALQTVGQKVTIKNGVRREIRESGLPTPKIQQQIAGRIQRNLSSSPLQRGLGPILDQTGDLILRGKQQGA